MPIRLDRRAPDFAERFHAFLATKREASADVEAAARAIIADVAARGDRALIELTRRFDGFDLDQRRLKLSADEIDAGYAACEARALDALALARDRIEAYHRRQIPADERFIDPLGVELGSRWTAIEAVGLYVPGGSAAYPEGLEVPDVRYNSAWAVSYNAVKPPWSTITAYDLNKGTIKWQVPLGTIPFLAAKGIKDTGASKFNLASR